MTLPRSLRGASAKLGVTPTTVVALGRALEHTLIGGVALGCLQRNSHALAISLSSSPSERGTISALSSSKELPAYATEQDVDDCVDLGVLRAGSATNGA